MNNTTYIFGKWGGKYTSYPFDYTQSVFECMAKQLVDKELLAVHRNGAVMHYVYLYRLNKNDYIGVADIVTDIYYTDIKSVLSKFQQVITLLATRGDILSFSPNGEIVASVDSLANEKEVVISSLSLLQNLFADEQFKKLPALNYSVGVDEKQVCSIIDINLIDYTCKYSYTYILLNGKTENISLKSYLQTIKEVEQRANDAEQQVLELKKNYKKLQKQKRQIKNVIWLLLFIIIGIVGVFFYIRFTNSQINGLRDDLLEAGEEYLVLNEQYEQKSGDFDRMRKKHEAVQTELVGVRADLKNANETIDALKKELANSNKDLQEQRNLVSKSNKDLQEQRNLVSKYRNEYKDLEGRYNAALRSNSAESFQKYKVIRQTNAYYYDNGNMKKSKTKLSYGQILKGYELCVYDGKTYCLTSYGYVPLSDMQRN